MQLGNCIFLFHLFSIHSFLFARFQNRKEKTIFKFHKTKYSLKNFNYFLELLVLKECTVNFSIIPGLSYYEDSSHMLKLLCNY